MTKSILITAVFGLLLGAALFFIPFAVLAVLLFFGLGRLFFSNHRGGRGRFGEHRLAFVEKVRSMDDAEFNAWKAKMETGNCGSGFKKNENN